MGFRECRDSLEWHLLWDEAIWNWVLACQLPPSVEMQAGQPMAAELRRGQLGRWLFKFIHLSHLQGAFVICWSTAGLPRGTWFLRTRGSHAPDRGGTDPVSTTQV